MAWRPHSQAYADPSNPQAWGQCDRCDRTFLLRTLRWQFQFAGPTLQNLRLLVCEQCYDIPQPQLKPRILPPDPMPVLNARPMNPEAFDIDARVTEDDDTRITEDSDTRVVENVANNREEAP